MEPTPTVVNSDPSSSPPMRRRFTMIGALALALVIGYFAGRGTDQSQAPSPQSLSGFTSRSAGSSVPSSAADRNPISADDPLWGPRDAAVTVVEFSDFECPYCAQAAPIMRELMARYGDRVAFQYRDFPIAGVHPYALAAAEAAECAHAQGGFWDYHDLLFQNQGSLTRENFTQYAIMTRLNLAEFNTCLDGRMKAGEVAEDLNAGTEAGVEGTPTFFINGIKFEGVLTQEEFQQVIEGLLP